MKYIITETQSNSFTKNIEKLLTKTHTNEDICGIEVIFDKDNKTINVEVFVSEDWSPRQNEELYKIRKEIKHQLRNYFIGLNIRFLVEMQFEDCSFYRRKKERQSS